MLRISIFNLDFKLRKTISECQNVFIYRAAYKTTNGEKPCVLRISFNNFCRYIEKDGRNDLSLMPLDENYEQIFGKI